MVCCGLSVRALEETNLTGQKGLVSGHERERLQHTGVAAVGSAGGAFSLVRLPWAHNLTDFSPRRGGLEALRWKWNAPAECVRTFTNDQLP